MKNFSLLTLLLPLCLMLQAQPTFQWASNLNGPTNSDYGTAITTDGNCNTYVVAASDGIFSSSDYLLIKYNAWGDTVWTKRYNGTANNSDIPIALKLDAAGNIFITGRSKAIGAGYNIVTIKYNSSGVQQWVTSFNGGANQDDIATGIEVDAFGNVYIVGFSFFTSGSTTTDAVIIKYGPNGGSPLWVVNYNYTVNMAATHIAINSSGNIIVPVWTDKVPFTTGGDYYTIEELDPSNGWVISSGNNHALPFKAGYPAAMSLDGNGNVFITSSYPTASPTYSYTLRFNHGALNHSWYQYNQTSGSWTIKGVDNKIDASGNTYVLSNIWSGNNDYKVTKLSSSGVVLWDMVYNSSGTFNDAPVALALDNQSLPNIYVTGYTEQANGTSDITTVKYSNTGAQLWSINYDCGNNGSDIATSMTLDGFENIYITGASNCIGSGNDVKTIKYSISAPTISVSASTNICNGSSTNLNASGGINYRWFPSTGLSSSTISNPTAFPNTTTTYYVTGMNNYCAANTVTVTVSISPDVSTSISGNGIILNSNATGASYQWYNCTSSSIIFGETNNSFTATSNGNYAVIVNQNGCVDTSTCIPVISVGINGATIDKALVSIFPNPSSGAVNIKLGNEVNLPVRVSIRNLLGELIYQENLSISSSLMELKVLTGIYFLTLENKEMNAKQKLFVEK